MQDGKTFLGTQPIKKLLPKLAVPTVIAQLVNMLYNIVDRIYIGHIPEVGSLALTGIGRLHAAYTHRFGLFGLRSFRRRSASVDIHGARRL